MVKKSDLIGKRVYHLRGEDDVEMYSLMRVDKSEKLLSQRIITKDFLKELDFMGQTEFLLDELPLYYKTLRANLIKTQKDIRDNFPRRH
jgi:hypothetical protein